MIPPSRSSMNLQETEFFRLVPTGYNVFPTGNDRKNVRNMEAVFRPELPGTGRFRAGLFDLGRRDLVY